MRLLELNIIVLLISVSSICVQCLPNQVKIGILLHESQYEQEILFNWSIEYFNQRGLLNRTKFIGLIGRVDSKGSWDAEMKACKLLEDGAIAIIGPSDAQTSQHVSSICDALDILHFNIVTKGVAFDVKTVSDENEDSASNSILPTRGVDLTISHSIIIKAYLSVMKALKWKHLVYLYEGDDHLYHLHSHLKDNGIKYSDIRIIRFDPAQPYREIFWMLKSSIDHRHIMLDVKCSNLRTVLKQAQQVSMMTEAHSYLIVCLDTLAYDLEDFKYSRSNIVWLNMHDQNSNSIKALQAQTNEGVLRQFDSGIRLTPERIKTDSALVHDAIETIAETLRGVDSSQYINFVAPVSCKSSTSLPYGSTMINYMRSSIDFNGVSGRVRFDPMGQRTDFKLNVMRLTEDGPKLIGNWTNSINSTLKLEREDLRNLRRNDPSLFGAERRDLLIVTSIRNEPYFMNKQTTKIENGNGRYEGYAIDLIDELSRLVGFDYEFKEVDDLKYGKMIDGKKKIWNGMIGEVMSGKADLAIADLSITSSREDAVDFTLPFMSTGISILFKKPTTKELELFSFLSPFEAHVWVYVCGAYIGVSLLLFAVGRISPYEWADPHPCRKEDKILRNQFSVTNSFWFTIAALMQQGSDLAPRSLSTRLVSAIWYFFTLIMISSYTANLAAFLTVEKVVYPIERAEELYRHPQHIKYGCVESGSTGTFFQQSKPWSTFKKMSEEMVFVQSNEQGKAEVEKGNYAFFMESTSIEYTIERNCNLTQIGGLLDSKGYGIALAKNSTRKRDYRTKLSEAILSLQESGMLEVLKNRWWKEKRGGGACDIDDSQGGEGVKELTLANVGGVFVVLGMGITISFILCALELYTKSYRLAKARGTTVWMQLKRRVDFALSLNENY